MSFPELERWLLQAQRQMEQGHLEGAAESLRRVLTLDPDLADAHAMLALCLLDLRRLHAAQHEAELAMMELFGSPGAEFFAVYGRHFPIDTGYARRRDLYNLYHILNHTNLFGGGYVGQAQRVTDSLLAQLG